MKPEDFVYDQCFKIGMRCGLQERDAEQIAAIHLEKYKNNSVKKPIDVFDMAEKAAKKAKKKGFIS